MCWSDNVVEHVSRNPLIERRIFYSMDTSLEDVENGVDVHVFCCIFQSSRQFQVHDLLPEPEVSGKEGCKYVAAWLTMILVLIVARCLGTLHRLNSSSFVFDLTHEAGENPPVVD